MFNNVLAQSTSAYDKTRTNTQKRNIKISTYNNRNRYCKMNHALAQEPPSYAVIDQTIRRGRNRSILA